jgi:regulatory protein
MYKKQLSKEQALQKLKHYCGYQERSHSEVKDKLYQLGVWRKDHDEIMASLIEENYLNEERFAIAFAGGRFRMKKWGRVKIKYELKQKQVSDYCIRKALNQIEDEEYNETLQKLASAKFASLKREQWLVRRKKTADYLLQKGYEMDLINKAISMIIQP